MHLCTLNKIHIDTYITYKTYILYQNGKDKLSLNVLVVMTFDFCYYYILPGWEESAHDSKALTDVVVNYRFSISEKKYYFIITKSKIQWDKNLKMQKSFLINDIQALKMLLSGFLGLIKNGLKFLYLLQNKTSKLKFDLYIPSLHCITLSEITHRRKFIILRRKKKILRIHLDSLTRINRKRDRIANQMQTDYIDISSCRRKTT